ncbi:MAG: M48 family metallopeptidase [Betaproteobacteria bacterium]|nr:M48 family metallopeptidase [Betaproteobacteria bacterium]MBL8532560.1 M48 family metallopeptidase [Betaproteobacteria bacterium]
MEDMFPVTHLDEPGHTYLNGVQVCFVLRRSRRIRRITLLVDESGLIVRAPWTASSAAIENAIAATSRWILRKLDEWRQKPAIRSRKWCSGETVDYLGLPVTLTVVEDRLLPLTELGEDRILRVGTPPGGGAKFVRSAVVAWYRRHARRHFPGRVAHFAGALDVALPTILVSDASSRWGSCNSKREVRLNWRLMQAAPRLVDYVVAHEVAHLLHLNHSARFWRAVERILPDHESARSELNAVSRHYMSL